MNDISAVEASAATHCRNCETSMVPAQRFCSACGQRGTSSNKDRSWLHQVTFALITALAIYVIVDLEYPRLGLIRVDAADQALIDLRAT